MDPRLAAELAAHEMPDEEFVDSAFGLVLRRPADAEARDRALGKLAEGTLSRATLIHELATSDESSRVRELDDAVALGLGARARRERIRWLQAPPGTDERVVEIPWVLSRLRARGRVLEIGYAFAENAYLGALLRSGVELVGADLASARRRGPRCRGGGRSRAPVRRRELRPGAARLDPRARRCRQRGLRARGRARSRRAPARAPGATPHAALERQPARDRAAR